MKSFMVAQPSSGALRALNYAPAIERIRRAGSGSARPLNEVVREFGPAHGTVFTRLDCHPDHGVELLSQSDMFASEPHGRVIRRDSMPQPERHIIKRGQILVAGAGTLGENEIYGRSILADDRLAGKYVGPDCMTLVFEDPDDDFSLFTYAWLASPTGVQAIRSTSYGTKILRFRPDLLQSLPVPMATPSVLSRVAKLVRKCSLGREESLRYLRAARQAVEQLPEMREAQAICQATNLRSVMWDGPFPSLSAWNFASSGGALAYLRKVWDARLVDCLDVDVPLAHGGRLTRVPCDSPHGVDFYSQRDVFMCRPVPQRIAMPVGSDWVFAQNGQLLMAADGQVTTGALFGRVELANSGFVGRAITEHIMRLNPVDGMGEFLAAFLGTSMGHRLTRGTATGTSVPKARSDLVLGIPVPPILTESAARAINAIQKSVEMRLGADAAEAAAICIIEQEVLPPWLG